MNRFYVITNTEKDKDLKTTRQIHAYLKARGCQCTVREFQKEQGSGAHGNQCIHIRPPVKEAPKPYGKELSVHI